MCEFKAPGTIQVDSPQAIRHDHPMLTIGMFTFVVATFFGCVWWACRDESV